MWAYKKSCNKHLDINKVYDLYNLFIGYECESTSVPALAMI